MRLGAWVPTLVIALALVGCSNAGYGPEDAAVESVSTTQQTKASPREPGVDEFQQEESEREVGAIRASIDGMDVAVLWEDNRSVTELTALAADGPLTIQLSMYGGWEQVGSIGTNLTSEDTQVTAQAGDIMLYSSDQIVVFYGSNSWYYTKLGHITDRTPDELTQTLGNDNVTLTITAE